MLKFSKLSWAGITFIVFGGASYLAEMIFYNDIDENGIVQESFFLPLAFILGLVGAVFFLTGCVRYFVRRGLE